MTNFEKLTNKQLASNEHRFNPEARKERLRRAAITASTLTNKKAARMVKNAIKKIELSEADQELFDSLINSLKEGHIESARYTASWSMDTYLRDFIPTPTWFFMGYEIN